MIKYAHSGSVITEKRLLLIPPSFLLLQGNGSERFLGVSPEAGLPKQTSVRAHPLLFT